MDLLARFGRGVQRAPPPHGCGLVREVSGGAGGGRRGRAGGIDCGESTTNYPNSNKLIINHNHSQLESTHSFAHSTEQLVQLESRHSAQPQQLERRRLSVIGLKVWGSFEARGQAASRDYQNSSTHPQLRLVSPTSRSNAAQQSTLCWTCRGRTSCHRGWLISGRSWPGPTLGGGLIPDQLEQATQG